MSRDNYQRRFQEPHPTIEFYKFDVNMPLFMFAGAKDFAAETYGFDVAFTIGPGVAIQPEGYSEAISLEGKRGIISVMHLRSLVDNIIPVVLGGTPRKLHRHHQITPEEALAMQGDFETALDMVDIAQANNAAPKVDWELGR